MPEMQLSCHCGAVLIKVPTPKQLTSCNCSICSRYGALWAYYDPNEVQIAMEESVLGRYLWGEKTIAYRFCQKCGCVTHYETLIAPAKIAVNFRMAGNASLQGIPIRKFDGADSWQYIKD